MSPSRSLTPFRLSTTGQLEGCSALGRTGERGPGIEDIQYCKLVTKHPRRNSNRCDLLEDTRNCDFVRGYTGPLSMRFLKGASYFKIEPSSSLLGHHWFAAVRFR